MSAKQKTNAGALALSETGKSYGNIARVCNVSSATAGNWLKARNLPTPTARATLRDNYGIDVTAWDQRFETDSDAKPAKTKSRAARIPAPKKIPPYPKPPNDPSILESARYSLVCIRHDARHRDLTFSDRTKLRGDETRALALVAKLETAAELSEDRYVKKHPAWLALRKRIIAALRPFPDAAKAVLEAMDA